MQNAIHRLAKASITAQIRHQSELFGQQLVGSGNYSQMHDGTRLKVRLELKLRTKEQTTSLRHINDGRFLWIHGIFGTDKKISRIDLDAVRNSIGNVKGHSNANAIALGGLPRLIGSLSQNFDFRTPLAITYQQTPVWAITGTWKPERLAALLPHLKELVDANQQIDSERLPPNFPDRVFVLLGRSDLFPYRVEYRKSERFAISKSILGREIESGTMLTMDLFLVNLNAELDPVEFQTKNLGDVRIEDKTASFIWLMNH